MPFSSPCLLNLLHWQLGSLRLVLPDVGENVKKKKQKNTLNSLRIAVLLYANYTSIK